MNQLRIILIAFCAGLQATVNARTGYNWGNSMEACKRMKPSTYNMMMELEDKKYYSLKVNKNVFEPAEKVLVRIMGKTMNTMAEYKGAFLTVGKESTEGTFGSWDKMHPSKYRSITCSGKMNSAIAEAMDVKTPYVVEEDVFVWNAPNDCMPGEMFQLKGTVVKDNDKILTGLSLRLTCSEIIVKPEPPENSCDANYFEGGVAGTSFEEGFGGWWNDPTSEMRWKRNKNETGSSLTGPSSAFDGEYYIYSEASYPAKPGDRAILNSPPGLNGCFCVRMQCHMLTGPGTILILRVNGIQMWNHTLPGDFWIQGWQSINDPNYPKIQMELTRGMDFRGDMALDAFEIRRGLCPETLAQLPIPSPIFENGKPVFPSVQIPENPNPEGR